MPHVPIDYTTPHTKRTSFSCGHVTPVWLAERLGWTPDRIWSVDNSRPEHRHCNVVDGARMGNRVQRAGLPKVVEPAECGRW